MHREIDRRGKERKLKFMIQVFHTILISTKLDKTDTIKSFSVCFDVIR